MLIRESEEPPEQKLFKPLPASVELLSPQPLLVPDGADFRVSGLICLLG